MWETFGGKSHLPFITLERLFDHWALNVLIVLDFSIPKLRLIFITYYCFLLDLGVIFDDLLIPFSALALNLPNLQQSLVLQ